MVVSLVAPCPHGVGDPWNFWPCLGAWSDLSSYFYFLSCRTPLALVATWSGKGGPSRCPVLDLIEVQLMTHLEIHAGIFWEANYSMGFVGMLLKTPGQWQAPHLGLVEHRDQFLFRLGLALPGLSCSLGAGTPLVLILGSCCWVFWGWMSLWGGGIWGPSAVTGTVLSAVDSVQGVLDF